MMRNNNGSIFIKNDDMFFTDNFQTSQKSTTKKEHLLNVEKRTFHTNVSRFNQCHSNWNRIDFYCCQYGQSV